MSAPHDLPTAAQLVAAVREFLQADVLPAVEGRVRFHTRVAINVLGMVEREIELGPSQAASHAERLASLGVADDAELARAVREGDLEGDPEGGALLDVLAEIVRDKLAVANPGHAE
ncbi:MULTISPECIES: DUF6285 domain-containing protein [Nonomuraea]|uniref:DUF6285 domain-containing protein n=1 Tax=Nonomuraea mangrovi TaxID=2316207 RepID=A0ABW4SMT4_9ACTN